jgi:hypothetical protein
MAIGVVLKFEEKRRHERYHKKVVGWTERIAEYHRSMKNLEGCEKERVKDEVSKCWKNMWETSCSLSIRRSTCSCCSFDVNKLLT